MVVDRSVDIGLIAHGTTHPELHSIDVVKDEVVAICSLSHPLASGNGSSSQSLGDTEFIVCEPGPATREITERLLCSNGISRQYTMESGSSEAIKQMVMVGRGVGFVSAEGVRTELVESRALAVDISPIGDSTLVLYAAYRADWALSSFQVAFIDALSHEESG